MQGAMGEYIIHIPPENTKMDIAQELTIYLGTGAIITSSTVLLGPHCFTSLMKKIM